MNFHLYSVTVRGPGHIAENMPNQDAVLTSQWEHGWLAVVSDGMGSRKHSDIGSKCVCQAVFHVLNKTPFNTPDHELINLINNKWLDLIGSIKPNDAAATCLIAWGNISGRIRLFQLGDGAVLYYGNEEGQLSQRSDYYFSNETTGIGISRKYNDWVTKEIILGGKKHGLVMMTDGISDDLIQTDQFVSYLIHTMHGKSHRWGKKWIRKQLENWPTPGHKDDKTLVLIFRK